MSYLTTLVVHESAVVRELLSTYILSEFSYFKVLSTDNFLEAVELMGAHRLDLIISGVKIKGGAGMELLHAMQFESLNEEAPFLLLVNERDQALLKQYQLDGLANQLEIPCSPMELRDKINQLVDPRKLRSVDRYHIPGLMMTLHLDQYDVEGEVHNISSNSLSCEVEMTEPDPEFFRGVYITLRFPSDYESVVLPEIFCKLIEIKVTRWDEDGSVTRVRVVWHFKEIPSDVQTSWDNLFSLIERQVKEKHLALHQ